MDNNMLARSRKGSFREERISDRIKTTETDELLWRSSILGNIDIEWTGTVVIDIQVRARHFANNDK